MENRRGLFQFILYKLKRIFRYGLQEIREVEQNPLFVEHKTHLLYRGALALMLLCIFFSLIPLSYGGYHTALTYFGLVLVFASAMVGVKSLNRPDLAAAFSAYISVIILGISFYTDPDPHKVGFDAFWLWILMIPFLVDYFAGLIMGAIASLSGFFLSVLIMWSPLRSHFTHYGDNILTYYPEVYLIVALWAWMIQYQIFGYQADSLRAERERHAQQEERIRGVEKQQEERIRSMEKQMAAYEENHSLVERYHHDLRHYTRVIKEYLEKGETERAISYLKEIDGNLDQVVHMTYCDNHLINSILSVFRMRLNRQSCTTKIIAAVPEDLKIKELDLTALLSNILEDACDALQKVEESKRLINVRIDYRDGKLRIQVENTCAVQTRFTEDGLPISTKEVRGGIGTKSVRDIAREYKGVAGFRQEGDRFITMVVIGC